MTIDLTEVEKTLRQRMKRSQYSGRADFEDAVQEGLIRAWRDIEAGKDEFRYVVNRAAFWARRYFFQRNNPPTGTLGRRSPGAIPPPGTSVHLVAWDTDHGSDKEENSWLPLAPGFEDTLIAELSFWDLISGLRQDHQRALYLRYYEDKIIDEVGRSKLQYAEKALKRKLGLLPPQKRSGPGVRVKRTYGSYKPRTHCNGGHEFVEGSFRIERSGHRRCTICEKAMRKRKGNNGASTS